MIVVVMGVCGCGKSSVGQALAQRQGWSYIEGDDLHPETNTKKMTAGIPLDDADRWPWLDRIAGAAREFEDSGRSVVVACSALKRAYRDRLRAAGPDVHFLHLAGDRELIHRRLSARKDHFMPPGLLDSQFAALEPPGDDEGAIVLDVSIPLDDLVQAAIQRL